MHVYPVEECHQKSCQKLHFPGTHKTTHIFGPQYTLDTPKNIFTPYVHIILYKKKFSNNKTTSTIYPGKKLALSINRLETHGVPFT